MKKCYKNKDFGKSILFARLKIIYRIYPILYNSICPLSISYNCLKHLSEFAYVKINYNFIVNLSIKRIMFLKEMFKIKLMIFHEFFVVLKNIR